VIGHSEHAGLLIYRVVLVAQSQSSWYVGYAGYVRCGSIILSFRFVRGISLFRMIKGYISLQNDEESIPEHT